MKIKPGMRFYSKYFKTWGTVTRYYSPDNWYFTLQPTFLQRIFCIKAKELKAKSHPRALRWKETI
jgi:hypothetical protein